MSIQVLIVDDSAVIRGVLSRARSATPATSRSWAPPSDPIEAREKIKTLDPDVVTLDIEMPNMNGLRLSRQADAAPGRCRW